jgi:zinc D-Ala-D-Ala carboxypeptidase
VKAAAVTSWLGGAAMIAALFAVSFALLVASGSDESGRASRTTGVDATDAQQVRVTTTEASPATSTPPDRTPPPLRRPDVAACTVGDKQVTDDPAKDWDTIVVDTANRLDPAYIPPDLVPVSQAGFPDNGDTVRAILVPDLAALRQAAVDHGTPFVIVSTFRDATYQRNLYEGRVLTRGPEEAAAFTARPGHSEHQLGTALDVLDPTGTELTTAFGATPVGAWLEANAHKYGFVISYPEGERDTTCYDYEPWHLRYVGRDLAERMHESGMSPREWLLSQAMAAG